jgi:hypothetical protein
MKKWTIRFYFLVLTFLLTACPFPLEREVKGTFSEIPTNLFSINSEYDDYNSDLKVQSSYLNLCFSSNRNSKGENYDFVSKILETRIFYNEGKFSVNEVDSLDFDYYHKELTSTLIKVNSTFNELGPYSIYRKRPGYCESCVSNAPYLFLFSNDETGHQDIKFVYFFSNEESTAPATVTFLNSLADDAYPTVTQDSSAIYFCSNRFGSFDIYRAELNNSESIYQNLISKNNKRVEKEDLISSTGDDKCPFIKNNVMIFTSNRVGGFGGFDLYYSLFENGKWSAPINFGEKVNTEYDEYRPLLNPEGNQSDGYYKGSYHGIYNRFTNDFILFSSNRPGGKGGFDLYYVGVPKIVRY